MDEPVLSSFLHRLRELGYVEGSNLKIQFRSAQNQPARLPRLAQELARLNPDAIFVTSTLAASELKRATSTIPIVMIGNPMDADLIADLSHPGANLTGLSIVSSELTAKRLQLLKQAVPRLKRVAVLWNSNESWAAKWVENLQDIAPALSIELTPIAVRTPQDLESTFAAISRSNAQALYVLESPLFFVHREKVVQLATGARL
jgi:putative ABC transport system substrate-binding protein